MSNQFKYILYARKSSEDKSRQVNSIEDQIKELEKLAKERGFLIVEVISESKSAKKPGREGFNLMLQKIHAGEADAILCWKLDRLARNPLDHGNISWMLQQGIIQRIQTHGNDYKPSDNVLMMQVEFGMATQYIKDLKSNIGRGMRQKAKRGWYPSPILPIGYKHNPHYASNDSKVEIIEDRNTWELIKQLWRNFLTGTFTVADLKRWGDAAGLRGKKGNKILLCSYHELLRNEFYMGQFHWKNETGQKMKYKGKHKALISGSEFQKAQELLGIKGKQTRLSKHIELFPFRGLVTCGECGGHVTAEFIHQVICEGCKYKYSIKTNSICKKCGTDYLDMKNPTEIRKKYYRCSKKKTSYCTQKSIEEKELYRSLSFFLTHIEIDPVFCHLLIEWVEELSFEALGEDINIPQVKKRLKAAKKESDNLLELQLKGVIPLELFMGKHNELNKEINQLENKIQDVNGRLVDIKSRAKKLLSKAVNITEILKKATNKEIKSILETSGYNLVLLDKKLGIIWPKWAEVLSSIRLKMDYTTAWVQPSKTPIKTRLFYQITDQDLILCSETELIQTCQYDQNVAPCLLKINEIADLE